MGKRVIVSGGDALRELAHGRGAVGDGVPCEGAGALLAAGERLFVACDRGDVIWRLDAGTLVPLGLFAGGPGVCQLLISRDAKRLYALCGDADSILMLDAVSGQPLVVNRAGVAPRAMAMDDAGGTIAVAGGAEGAVILFDAQSLRTTGRLQTPGVVFSVCLAGKRIHALSLCEDMNAALTTFCDGGCSSLQLSGMPGVITAMEGRLCAATHEGLYLISDDGARVLACASVPGRAGRLIHSESGLLMADVWSESLFLRGRDGRWKPAMQRVRDAVCIE